jgi:hypothetical protein
MLHSSVSLSLVRRKLIKPSCILQGYAYLAITRPNGQPWKQLLDGTTALQYLAVTEVHSFI